MKKVFLITIILLAFSCFAYALPSKLRIQVLNYANQTSPFAGGTSMLLLENGDYFLLENGDNLILE